MEKGRLVGYSPKGRKKSDTTEQLSVHACMGYLLCYVTEESAKLWESPEVDTNIAPSAGMMVRTSSSVLPQRSVQWDALAEVPAWSHQKRNESLQEKTHSVSQSPQIVKVQL